MSISDYYNNVYTVTKCSENGQIKNKSPSQALWVHGVAMISIAVTFN